MNIVAIIGKTSTGYSAHLPGRIAVAGTFEETRDLIQSAAAFHLEGMIEDDEQIPEPIYAAIEVEVQVSAPATSQQAIVETGR